MRCKESRSMQIRVGKSIFPAYPNERLSNDASPASLRIRKLPRAICSLDQLAAYRYWLSMSVPIDERRSRLMIFIVTASSVVRLHFTQRSDLQSTAIDIGHCEGTGST
ncbi:unnamed protein product [Trichogramma brassicae]|uniref:Uncharacterized protein n=1 Tax=Trichogramma brassicae TaxID=86971 RepID=A0A6H5IVB6_9HYME|nr:unnamed protein product [Trichogramma brassicae]